MVSQLAPMTTLIDEELLVTMFVKCFGNRLLSLLSAVNFGLLTNDNLTEESATAGLVQKDVCQKVSKSAKFSTNELAYASYTQKTIKV